MKKFFCLFLCAALLCGCQSMPVSNPSDGVYPLSDRVTGWGMRRKEGRSEFTAEQIKMMNDFGCIYMGKDNDKSIYLTFDEGYENGYTSLILDTLYQKGVPAAFFVTGAYVKSEPELIARMSREGHIIGNHTVNHPCVPKLSENEIVSETGELDRLIYGICKKKCKYFRPPKGEYSEHSLKIINDLGYKNTFWSFAYVDWDNKVSKADAYDKITSGLHDGCVLLLHAVSKGNAEALPDVIDYARKQGYVFKSLDEYIP